MSDTGNQATLTLSVTGSVGDIRTMDLPEWLLEKINDSHLGTDNFETFCPGDLSDPGEISGTVVFDATAALPNRGVVETATITLAISTTGNTTNATLVGTGFLTRTKLPNLANNQLNEWEFTFAFDGKTEPAFTPESA